VYDTRCHPGRAGSRRPAVLEPFVARGIRIYRTAEDPIDRVGMVGPGHCVRVTPTISWSWNGLSQATVATKCRRGPTRTSGPAGVDQECRIWPARTSCGARLPNRRVPPVMWYRYGHRPSTGRPRGICAREGDPVDATAASAAALGAQLDLIGFEPGDYIGPGVCVRADRTGGSDDPRRR
jgi:hypothetical protein